MTTKASERPVRIRIPRRTWSELLRELAARGGGRRESGAFLLGHRRGFRTVVRQIVYFDDLEPESLNGAVHLTTFAYSELYDICRESGFEVIGDIHTHPDGLIDQSHIDQDNPLVAQRGHIALIVGHYAQRAARIRDIGVYEYRGDDGWSNRPRALRHHMWF